MAGLLPEVSIYLGGNIVVTQIIKPRYCFSIINNSAGDDVRTIIVADTGENSYFNIELFVIPASNNYYEGHAKICGGRQNGPLDFHAEVYGVISNARTVNYNNDTYIAVDVIVRQYGSCYVLLKGLHSNPNCITDITGLV